MYKFSFYSSPLNPTLSISNNILKQDFQPYIAFKLWISAVADPMCAPSNPSPIFLQSGSDYICNFEEKFASGPKNISDLSKSCSRV